MAKIGQIFINISSIIYVQGYLSAVSKHWKLKLASGTLPTINLRQKTDNLHKKNLSKTRRIIADWLNYELTEYNNQFDNYSCGKNVEPAPLC